MYQVCADLQIHIARAQKYAVKRGVSRTVRVVGKSVLPQVRFDRNSKDAGYTADFFSSVL